MYTTSVGYSTPAVKISRIVFRHCSADPVSFCFQFPECSYSLLHERLKRCGNMWAMRTDDHTLITPVLCLGMIDLVQAHGVTKELTYDNNSGALHGHASC